MGKKAAFIVGAAAGYVLGARAGRQSYEKIRARAKEIWASDQVQDAVGTATSTAAGFVSEQARTVGRTVVDKVKDKVGVGGGPAGSSTTPYDAASDPDAGPGRPGQGSARQPEKPEGEVV